MKKYLAQTVVNSVSNIMSCLTRLPIVGNRIKRDFVPKTIQPMEFHYPSTFLISSLTALVINDQSFYRLKNLARKEPQTMKFFVSDVDQRHTMGHWCKHRTNNLTNRQSYWSVDILL